MVGLILCATAFLVNAPAAPARTRTREKISYGEGLIINIPVREEQVIQVVQDVAQNGVIRGTKEYNKDEFISGATAASSSRILPWSEGGRIFYKIREQALDPRNFTAGGDLGTLVVRYVVQPQGETNTVLRIDAVFAEQYRHTIHQSDGSVESSEYKDIRDRLDAIEQMEKQNAQAVQERQQQLQRKQQPGGDQTGAPLSVPSTSTSTGTLLASPGTLREIPPVEAPTHEPGPGAAAAGQTLEEHVKDLRRQVERLVKAPGAALKSAPFHTASTLDSMAPGAEVLILISTPYWYGVETRKGQRGWVMRDEVEQP